MRFLKKHWYLVLVSIFTLGLGVVVYLTSQQLANTQQVAPTAPQAKPKAAASACELAFAINLTPTDTPTPTPTPGPTNTPTPTPTPIQIVYVNPTATPTPVQIVYVNPTATPTPVQVVQQTVAGCNNTCTVNTDCTSGLVCISGSCRSASCAADTSCTCGAVINQPTPKTPVSGGPTVLGASVIGIGTLILILGLAL